MWGGLGLPEFRGEDAGEAVLLGDSGEAGLGERGGVVGEVGGAEAGEEAEGEVEAADEELLRGDAWRRSGCGSRR